MGMFTRLFGGKAGAVERSLQAARAANLVPPQPMLPSFVEAIPKRLTVAFHAHAGIDGFDGQFLTAVTQGMTRCGQRELVLTLRLAEREDPIAKMQEIARFFCTVYAWAQQGNMVDEGGFTRFGERGLFGRSQGGLLYSDARPIQGVDIPKGALAAILVDAPEIRAAVDFGTYRVLSRIGAQLRLFPFPTWGALDRPSAMTPRESESCLAKVARVRVRGAFFVRSERCLSVSVPRGIRNLLSGMPALPPGAPFALLLRPAPNANALLVWRPGQVEMSGLSPEGGDGSRLSGSFLMVQPGREVDEARQLEDGYALLLRNESWARLQRAVAEERPLSIDLSGDERFELEWQSTHES